MGADVIASRPTFPNHEVNVLVPDTPGLAEYVDLETGKEYVVFANTGPGGEVFLTSANQGVFPVSNGTVGRSQLGPFPLGASISGQLGLKG